MSGAANGVCPLDGSSLIPAVYLPSITVHNTFVVASQSAMLALAAHQGDVAIRTDINESFILTNNVPTVLGNWSQLLTPASSVTSVNGLIGTVTLTTSSIAEGTNLYYTTARAKADAIAAALTGFSNTTGGSVTAGDSILTALGRLENRCALNDAKLTGSDRVKIDGSVALTGALTFTGSANAGMVLSNLSDAQRAALTPANGMLLYDTTLSQMMFYNGSWQPVAAGGGTTWFNGSGAPASTLGNNGNYYLDAATGNIYLKASGSWSIIYSPTIAALPTTGGTMTGILAFSATPGYGSGDVVQFPNGWSIRNVTSGNFQISANSGALAALNLNYNGSSECDLVVQNGTINVTQSSFGYQVAGIKVVGAQQAHIAHDASGAANQVTVNAIITALEMHGLVHT